MPSKKRSSKSRGRPPSVDDKLAADPADGQQSNATSSASRLPALDDTASAAQLAERAKKQAAFWSRDDMQGPLWVDPQESLMDRSLDRWFNTCERWDALTLQWLMGDSLAEPEQRELRRTSEEISFCAGGWNIDSRGLMVLVDYLSRCEMEGCAPERNRLAECIDWANQVVRQVRDRSKYHAMEGVAAVRNPLVADQRAPSQDKDVVTHLKDFTWLRVGDVTYTFSKGQQAQVMKALYEAWLSSGRTDGAGMTQETLADRAASSGTDFRIRKLFRKHPALGTILRPSGKGQWALWLRDDDPGRSPSQKNPG